jgi:alanyl-tRNA synthetase
MNITHRELRNRFSDFLRVRNHKEVPPISLVPQNDPTTLFTGSGMQQFVPYLLGEVHPQGNKLFNIQPCIRVQDIEEVGDNRHDTFFEMMGNWSLGDYFKKDQLENLFLFLTDKKTGLGINPNKLFVTVFEGDETVPEDSESVEIWRNIFKKAGLSYGIGERIFKYPATKNWWSRAGIPENMPVGEPGGPDSEIFYDFGTPHDKKFGENCHPNCDCGRFMEIGNSVFMQYKKTELGTFENLPKMNVDFGGGLERLLSASNNEPDIFKTDVFLDIIKTLEEITKTSYEEESKKSTLRIIADHFKTAVFIINSGVLPSNKEQGYVLRRLLRRALVKIKSLCNVFSPELVAPVVLSVINSYEGVYLSRNEADNIIRVISDEIFKFQKSLDRGLREIDKKNFIDAHTAFDLYQSYGFPLELTKEIAENKGQKIDIVKWHDEVQKHKEKSRTSSESKFKGGLADNSEQTVKYHTATHLIHQALFDLVGNSIRQEGSNITADRLRFDFYSSNELDESLISKVEAIVNSKIHDGLMVKKITLPKKEAEKLEARSFFKEKYPENVDVYYIAKESESIIDAYSKEFCGGPHVSNTKEIGSIKVFKLKKIGSNMYRIYVK